MNNRANQFQTFSARVVLVLLLWLVFQAWAHAQSSPAPLSQAGYRTYGGDVNGDGVLDVLVKSLRIAVIPLDDDLLIPILLPPGGPTFALLSGASGTYTLVVDPDASIVNSPVWQADSHDVVFGDVLGNGSDGMVLRARAPGGPSFVVARLSGTGTLQLLEQLTTARLGVDLSAAGTTVALSDANGDGRADMTVRVNGLVTNVFLADANGMFDKAPGGNGNSTATIQAVWNDFRAALNTGNTAAILQHVSAAAGPYYSSVLSSIGTAVTTLTPFWSGLDAVQIGPDFATFAMVETYDGQRTMHLIGFVQESGRWVLEDF